MPGIDCFQHSDFVAAVVGSTAVDSAVVVLVEIVVLGSKALAVVVRLVDTH